MPMNQFDYSNFAPNCTPMNATLEHIPSPKDSRTVFIANLSYFCREDHLLKLFFSFGKIESIKLRKGQQGITLMYGFVVLDSPTAAINAVNALNGKRFMGRDLRTQIRNSSQDPNVDVRVEDFFHVHFNFKANPIELNQFVTEDHFRMIFEPFGPVKDVSIKRYSFNKLNQHSGYGFIYFYRKEDAERAIDTINERVVHGIYFDLQFSSTYSGTPSLCSDNEDAIGSKAHSETSSQGPRSDNSSEIPTFEYTYPRCQVSQARSVPIAIPIQIPQNYNHVPTPLMVRMPLNGPAPAYPVHYPQPYLSHSPPSPPSPTYIIAANNNPQVPRPAYIYAPYPQRVSPTASPSPYVSFPMNAPPGMTSQNGPGPYYTPMNQGYSDSNVQSFRFIHPTN